MSTHPNENIIELNVKSIFSANGGHYVVPVYQRDYAWGRSEISQLIQDIMDYSVLNHDKKYYIGTLVVYQRLSNGISSYEVIDGQQRLTTFFILLSYLRKENHIDLEFNGKLHFESRPKSIVALKDMYSIGSISANKEYNTNLVAGYEMLKGILSEKFKDRKFDKHQEKHFYQYLQNNVTILRVAVPEDTDLNHYFEIMNNRGEQLEKTEIVKAYFLSTLKDEENGWRSIFSEVWEAAANMQTYVQYGFGVDRRKYLFGDDYATLKINSYQELEGAFDKKQEDSSKSESMHSIIGMESIIQKKEYENDSERFASVINFSNFLIQVLKVYCPDKDISLDDKRLLDFFQDRTKDINFVKAFCFQLLKSRYMFDKYIIKRETTSKTDNWSLKKLKKSGDSVAYNNTFPDEVYNKNLTMILSMFHVSNPSLLYKYWLTAALRYTLSVNELELQSNYLTYLERLAEVFLRNRYLSHNREDFNVIVSSNILEHQITDDIDTSLLNKGTEIENFVFNYLDYKLWKKDRDHSDTSQFKAFEFTFRSSIEHFYPQNPIEGNDNLEVGLHHFGNLCLISNRVNSKLSNYMPGAKADHYKSNPSAESIKQAIMVTILKEKSQWGTNEIMEHGLKMERELLLNVSEEY